MCVTSGQSFRKILDVSFLGLVVERKVCLRLRVPPAWEHRVTWCGAEAAGGKVSKVHHEDKHDICSTKEKEKCEAG